MKRFICSALLLVSSFVYADDPETIVERYFHDAVKATKKDSVSFVESFVLKKDFTHVYGMFCDELQSRVKPEALPVFYNDTQRFVKTIPLGEFNKISIYGVELSVTEAIPTGVLKYYVQLKEKNGLKLLGNVQFDAAKKCIWGWKLNYTQ